MATTQPREMQPSVEGTAGWNEVTLRPQGDAEVERTPDGPVELHWVWADTQVNVLLNDEQLRALISRALEVEMLGPQPVGPARER